MLSSFNPTQGAGFPEKKCIVVPTKSGAHLNLLYFERVLSPGNCIYSFYLSNSKPIIREVKNGTVEVPRPGGYCEYHKLPSDWYENISITERDSFDSNMKKLSFSDRVIPTQDQCIVHEEQLIGDHPFRDVVVTWLEMTLSNGDHYRFIPAPSAFVHIPEHISHFPISISHPISASIFINPTLRFEGLLSHFHQPYFEFFQSEEFYKIEEFSCWKRNGLPVLGRLLENSVPGENLEVGRYIFSCFLPNLGQASPRVLLTSYQSSLINSYSEEQTKTAEQVQTVLEDKIAVAVETVADEKTADVVETLADEKTADVVETVADEKTADAAEVDETTLPEVKDSFLDIVKKSLVNPTPSVSPVDQETNKVTDNETKITTQNAQQMSEDTFFMKQDKRRKNKSMKSVSPHAAGGGSPLDNLSDASSSKKTVREGLGLTNSYDALSGGDVSDEEDLTDTSHFSSSSALSSSSSKEDLKSNSPGKEAPLLQSGKTFVFHSDKAYPNLYVLECDKKETTAVLHMNPFFHLMVSVKIKDNQEFIFSNLQSELEIEVNYDKVTGLPCIQCDSEKRHRVYLSNSSDYFVQCSLDAQGYPLNAAFFSKDNHFLIECNSMRYKDETTSSLIFSVGDQNFCLDVDLSHLTISSENYFHLAQFYAQNNQEKNARIYLKKKASLSPALSHEELCLAADLGFPDSQYELGMHYAKDTDSNKNKLGFMYLAQATLEGSDAAKKALETYFPKIFGLGGNPNLFANLACQLLLFYSNSKPMNEIDLNRSRLYFLWALYLQHPDAIKVNETRSRPVSKDQAVFLLGKFYLDGRGVVANKQKAMMMLNKAKDLGSEQARKLLEVLE